ncbi:hypothetical protein [Actinokineospora inagensis]|uniref:hypothetical protein n=1 Tax=Actinokineospora inagensis TaxID=103730 RepID=UPI0012F8592E|nr:hypothetical protein [Actinokineospora inagensis]
MAGVVRWVGLLVAALLVVHVVLVMANADRGNVISAQVREFAEPLALWFRTLFTLDDVKLGVLINFGIAVVCWLVVSTVVSKLIRRLG